MRALAVLAIVVASASACPGGPGCDGDGATKIELDGKKCNDCTLEFGAVDVGLQEHRRLDVFLGCAFAASIDAPSLSDESVFSFDQTALPTQSGQTGFVDITFTPADASDAKATVDFGNGLKAELHGKGVTP